MEEGVVCTKVRDYEERLARLAMNEGLRRLSIIDGDTALRWLDG
jgi:hypothetical protein